MTGLTQWPPIVAYPEGTRPAAARCLIFMLFEMLARRTNISNKKKEKYHTAVGHSADSVGPPLIHILCWAARRDVPLADVDEEVMTVAYSEGAARRITWTLFVAQSIGSAALIANATVNPIVGV